MAEEEEHHLPILRLKKQPNLIKQKKTRLRLPKRQASAEDMREQESVNVAQERTSSLEPLPVNMKAIRAIIFPGK